MKEQTKKISSALVVLLASASLGFAQDNNSLAGTAFPDVPGASNNPAQAPEPVGPGTVNYIEGQATLNGEELSPRAVGAASVKPGEVLDTADGYVEILLTPGSFLRVGHNSEIRFVSAGLAQTQVELVRGAAMLEIDQLIKGTNLSMMMNGATVQFEENGLYELNAAQQAVRVLDGKATVSLGNRSQSLGKHAAVLLTNRNPLKRQSFNEKQLEEEPLYVWSKARSQDESQASAYAASNADSYASAGPGWYWDPALNYYGFWPVADLLYSPFGWGFYSPAYFGFYGGYGWYGHGWYRGQGYHGWSGHPGNTNAGLRASHVSGFSGSSFHASGFGGGGFGGGGFHGGGGGGHR